jgi:hypothetical protein
MLSHVGRRRPEWPTTERAEAHAERAGEERYRRRDTTPCLGGGGWLVPFLLFCVAARCCRLMYVP